MKFKTIKDIALFVRNAAEKVNELTQLADISMKKLSAGVVLDISAPGKGTVKRTVNVDFPIVDIPNKAKLTQSYNLAEEMSQQYRELEDAEAQIQRSFGQSDNKHLQSAIGSIRKLKTDLERKLRQLFTELNTIAEGHAPKEYKRFVQKLAQELDEKQHIECDSIETFTYVAVSKPGDLMFAGYIVLVNAVSDEGMVIPHLYVTVRWTVAHDGGVVEVFVEHDFVEPGRLQAGELVKDTKEAVRVITNQLSLEGFSSQIGNLPIDMQLRDSKGMTPDAFSAAPYVDKIVAERDTLTFVMKSGIGRIEEIQMQLYQEVRKLLKNKRQSRLKMKPYDGKKIVFTITQMDQSSGITPFDLEWLEDKYNLTQPQLRRIANEINGG